MIQIFISSFKFFCLRINYKSNRLKIATKKISSNFKSIMISLINRAKILNLKMRRKYRLNPSQYLY